MFLKSPTLTHRDKVNLNLTLSKCVSEDHVINAMTSTPSLSQSPYAIKLLRRKLMSNPKRFANGAIDLTLEGVYLSSFQHPNIMKLHGMSSDGPEGYYRGRHDSYFLIVRSTFLKHFKIESYIGGCNIKS